ncbi:MAG: heme ABC exporter ATP-binding protein CcmA [Vicinamibacterales bacterium]
MTAARLHADRLTRTFGERVAVQDLSLSVYAGEIVSLLGPNGAGKTTTLRMLAGLLAPTAGSIAIDGTPVSAHRTAELRRSVGILTEAPGLWEGLTVRLNLLTYARLYGLADPAARVDDALALVDLADRAADSAGTLSKGLKQRCALARALVHRPSIVLLDEPTAGLDPAAARHVRDLLSRLRREGHAVLVSTHNLAEAEELSDRIAILNMRLMAVDTPDALRRRVSTVRVIIEVEGDAVPWVEVAGRSAPLVSATDNLLNIEVADFGAVPNVVAELVGAGARIRRVTPEQRSLEEVYLDLVGWH